MIGGGGGQGAITCFRRSSLIQASSCNTQGTLDQNDVSTEGVGWRDHCWPGMIMTDGMSHVTGSMMHIAVSAAPGQPDAAGPGAPHDSVCSELPR